MSITTPHTVPSIAICGPPGNLNALVFANGTIAFRRVDDGVELLASDASFNSSASSEPDYWQVGLDVTTPESSSLVYGLGQLEGTKSQGGCPTDGEQVGGRDGAACHVVHLTFVRSH